LASELLSVAYLGPESAAGIERNMNCGNLCVNLPAKIEENLYSFQAFHSVKGIAVLT
jgi:hypothetical protein